MTKRMDKKQFARHLRECENSYETLLWQLLRNRRRCIMKFRRQHTIDIYTVNFYCAERNWLLRSMAAIILQTMASVTTPRETASWYR